MTDSLPCIVYWTVRTFRPTARPNADDIRFAATVDGYDMTPYTDRQIGSWLARIPQGVGE